MNKRHFCQFQVFFQSWIYSLVPATPPHFMNVEADFPLIIIWNERPGSEKPRNNHFRVFFICNLLDTLIILKNQRISHIHKHRSMSTCKAHIMSSYKRCQDGLSKSIWYQVKLFGPFDTLFWWFTDGFHWAWEGLDLHQTKEVERSTSTNQTQVTPHQTVGQADKITS